MTFVHRFARMVGRVVGVAGQLFLALLVALLIAIGVTAAAGALGMAEPGSRIVWWAVLLAVAGLEVVIWRRGRQRAAANRRAAAQEVRLSDPHRYWTLLETTEALATERKRDDFVGRLLIEEQLRAHQSEWVASSRADSASRCLLTWPA